MYRINESTCVELADVLREKTLLHGNMLGSEFVPNLKKLPSIDSVNIYDAEPITYLRSHKTFQATIDTERINCTQGKNALKITAVDADNDGTWGMMAFVDFTSEIDLTKYKNLMCDLYIPQELAGMNGGAFYIKFYSANGNKQDGYNWSFGLANRSAGWYRLTTPISNLKKDTGSAAVIVDADWSRISGFSLMWQNGRRKSEGYFIFDNLRAYN